MFEAIGRRAQVLAGAILAAVALAHAAGAQTPAPTPRASASPAPTPVAFSAHAHVNVTVGTSNGPITGSVQLGVAQRANLTRVDVLSVKSDTLPLPPLSVTAVIDRGTNTLTAWNDVTKQYRVQPFLSRAASPRPSASPAPSASPRPATRGTSPFANLEVLALTVKLIGHTMTSGLPTTGLALDFQVQRKSDKAPMHVTATTQLADEFSIFPMTLDASLEPGGTAFSAKLSYAVDDLTRETPPLTRFEVPAGYTEAPSLLSLVLSRRPTMMSPSPAPTPK